MNKYINYPRFKLYNKGHVQVRVKCKFEESKDPKV